MRVEPPLDRTMSSVWSWDGASDGVGLGVRFRAGRVPLKSGRSRELASGRKHTCLQAVWGDGLIGKA